MKIPGTKSLERVWRKSVLFTALLAGLAAFVGYCATGGTAGLASIAQDKPALSLIVEGTLLCVTSLWLTYAISQIFYFFGCKIACPEIKPFVNGMIGPDSILNSPCGYRFTTDSVPFWSRTLGRMVDVYYFKTDSEDTDKYLAKYIQARDTVASSHLPLMCLIIAVFSFL